MASLKFNTAATDSNEEGISNVTAGTINDNTMDSTAAAGQGRTPKRLRFDLEPSHAQAMTVTPGTQAGNEDPNDKEGIKGRSLITVGLVEPTPATTNTGQGSTGMAHS